MSCHNSIFYFFNYREILEKFNLFTKLLSLTLDSSWLSVHLSLADSHISLYMQ